jgi:hypothetical protein
MSKPKAVHAQAPKELPDGMFRRSVTFTRAPKIAADVKNGVKAADAVKWDEEIIQFAENGEGLKVALEILEEAYGDGPREVVRMVNQEIKVMVTGAATVAREPNEKKARSLLRNAIPRGKKPTSQAKIQQKTFATLCATYEAKHGKAPGNAEISQIYAELAKAGK